MKSAELPKWIVLGACSFLLAGCGAVRTAWIWFPQAAGMAQVDPKLYVESSMTNEQRQEVSRQIKIGRAQVDRFYGSITATPYFVACVTSKCDERFGSYGTRAAAFGDTAVHLSANGLSAPLVAHELSHAELFHRVGGWWNARKIPRWFDEGIAVVVADEPRHSEENWQEIRRRGLPVPQLSELVSFKDWEVAVNRYGETAGDVPGSLHVVYTSVGHEVRMWLGSSGSTAVTTALESIRNGSTFDEAYAKRVVR